MTDATTERADDVLSPSQIETWCSCPRKGGFKYLARVPDPGNQDTELGKLFHALLERWLLEGVGEWMPFDLDGFNAEHEANCTEEMLERAREMAEIARAYLPLPLTKEERESGTERLRVEGEFQFDMHGVKMLGYKDLEHWKGDVFVVHDHKSCGSFKYVKTAEVLRSDVQGVTYAQHAFQKHPELKALEENWDYTTKGKEPQHRRVHLTVYREDVDAKARQIADIGREIVRIKREFGRTIEDVNTLPVNLETCSKFRGCPYREDVCSLTPMQRAKARLRHHNSKGPEPMNFKDMQARLAAAKANGTKTETTAPTTTVEVKTTTQTETPATTAPTTSIREKVGLATGINPPPTVSQPTTSVATSAGLTSALQASVYRQDVDAKGAEVTAQVAHSLEGQDPKIVETTPKKRGGGRPAGSKNKPKTEEQITQAREEHIESLPETDTEGFTLFVNCIPCKTSYSLVMFSDLIAPVQEAIRTEYGAAHWSLIDHGQGKGVLADALKQKLEQEPPGLRVGVVVNDRDPDVGPCLGVLERAARVVVRGF